MASPSDIEIAALLNELGFENDESRKKARGALVEAKLLSAKLSKKRISLDKRSQVEALLFQRFHVSCANEECREDISEGQEPILVGQRARCQVCGGSSNKRALEIARQALARAKISRIVVVGGSPNARRALLEIAPGGEWELRLVDGTEPRTKKDARNDIEWADLVLVWGSTQLDHKVSEHYTSQRPPHVVSLNKRSLAELFKAAAEHAEKRNR